MKKIVVLAASILAFSVVTCKAQEEADIRKKLVLGAKAGMNISNVYDQKVGNYVADPKAGFAGGIFLGIPLGKYLGIQPEVLFSQKGYQSTGTMLGGSYSDTRTTSFMDIPLQVQFKPIDFLTFLGGVQYSYLLHQSDVYGLGTNSVAQEQEFKNDNARKNIFGAVFGVDATIKHFLISGKACWDLQNNAGNGSSYTPRYKNIWFQLTVGFRLYR